ncbi:3-deoxy-manno-octulosonate cytidylyltransferase [Maribacter stanieri]|uniref:3-deoxy-manno-octulosonate cytidylyltransferase n=1 Tax=Maribacter stanieri TaxID=440514 RepID=UPI0030D773CE|tara:strand:- start:206 stop:946 length:741 start_codon:yes stop_codon:yes gene_type:complete
MRTIGVIPARYKSSRFPGKPLVDLAGTPMIIRVARIVEKALGKEHTFIATESDIIKETVESYGYNVVMTSDNCLTGTDRVWEVAQKIDADVYVNVQGDEPLLDYRDILKIGKAKEQFIDHVVNGMCPLSKSEDPKNINIPKVVVNKHNILTYMSRLPIPGLKDLNGTQPIYKKQVCIYAFNYNELKAFGEETSKGTSELYEDIEILRFIDLNIPIKMVETSGSSLAVDVVEDVVVIVNELLKIAND